MTHQHPEPLVPRRRTHGVTERIDHFETPLMINFWAPHWILAEVDAEWVDMPPCQGAENERCINPPEVVKIVWSGFEDKWPAAYKFLEELQIDTETQQQIMLRVDKLGEDLDAVIAEWISENESVWSPWIEAAEN